MPHCRPYGTTPLWCSYKMDFQTGLFVHHPSGLYYDAAMKLVRCALVPPQPPSIPAFYALRVSYRVWWCQGVCMLGRSHTRHVSLSLCQPSIRFTRVPGQYLNPMDSRYYTYNEATRGYESFVPPPPEGDPPEPAPGYSMQFVSLPLTHDQQAKADKVREGGVVLCMQARPVHRWTTSPQAPTRRYFLSILTTVPSRQSRLHARSALCCCLRTACRRQLALPSLHVLAGAESCQGPC